MTVSAFGCAAALSTRSRSLGQSRAIQPDLAKLAGEGGATAGAILTRTRIRASRRARNDRL